MKSLLSLFIVMSLLLGPLQGVWADGSSGTALTSASAFAVDADVLTEDPNVLSDQDKADLKDKEKVAMVEQVLLKSVMNRTRLFEHINSTLYKSISECFVPGGDQKLVVFASDQCQNTVRIMLQRAHENYPKLRKMYALYNLLRHTRQLVPMLGEIEGFGFTGQTPTKLNLSALDFTNPIETSILDTDLTNKFLFKATPQDIQAAATGSGMYIMIPGQKPSEYDLSFSGYMQKYCNDYIFVHRGDRHLWPAHPQLVCADFDLRYNTITQQFTFKSPNAWRDTNGRIIHGENEEAFYYEVVSEAIYKSIGDMIMSVRHNMVSLIQESAFVPLLGSENPSIDEIGRASQKIAEMAISNAAKYEKKFTELSRNVSNRYEVLKVLDRKQVVQNVREFPSSAMTDLQVSSRVQMQVLDDLVNKRDKEAFQVGMVEFVGGFALGLGCGLIFRGVPWAATSCGVLMTVGITADTLIEGYQDFHTVFAELFASSYSGSDEVKNISKDKVLSQIDSVVLDPQFNMKQRVLRDLEEMDDTHSEILWGWAFSLMGYGLGKYAGKGAKATVGYIKNQLGVRAETVSYIEGRFRPMGVDLRGSSAPSLVTPSSGSRPFKGMSGDSARR